MRLIPFLLLIVSLSAPGQSMVIQECQMLRDRDAQAACISQKVQQWQIDKDLREAQLKEEMRRQQEIARLKLHYERLVEQKKLEEANKVQRESLVDSDKIQCQDLRQENRNERQDLRQANQNNRKDLRQEQRNERQDLRQKLRN